ncbi:Gfo/Idh/MocA family oxidoreductase [Clostridium sp. YIM B02506]|uniref:Gfo/Idh/MocA family protein n=1 Tax=Clostridium sp. YIM B02506 TaxID=2910680 RepID=UPI001EED4694|nr:Gfo/Idh/MocA family oxidoreductase [Clostridium sp. YIM B02506]
MKIGILGTGFGAYHAQIYSKLKNIDSIIIWGRDEVKLRNIKNDINIKTTTNINDILDDPDISLIDICIPSSLHKNYTIEALKNGKHVFCETPVALTLEDAILMEQASKKYNKKIFVDMFIKFDGPYDILYKLVKEKKYGELKALHLKRKTPPLWGFLGLDEITTKLMLHEFDFVTWLLGPSDDIISTAAQKDKDKAHVETIMNYENSFVEIQCSSMMPEYHPFTTAYEAVFENGTLEYLENGYYNRTEKSLKLFTDECQQEIELSEVDCYESAIKHILECLEKDVPSKLSIDEAIISLETALKVKEIIS